MKNSCCRVCYVLTLLVANCFVASAREFTDIQGRKLEGELVSVKGPDVVIKRSADSKLFTLPVSQFSKEDQKLMADFAVAKIKFTFDVKLTQEKLGVSKSKEDSITSTQERWAYKVDVTNRSSADATDLHVDYWLFLKADDGKIKTGPRVQQASTATVGDLKRNNTRQFQTKPVVLSKSQLDGGFYFTDGTKNKARDTLGGVAMRFFQGDKEVFSWATDPELLKMASGKHGAEEIEAAQ